MSRSVQCPGCAKQYPITPEFEGKKVQCTTCGTTFDIPDASAAGTSGAKAPSTLARGGGSKAVQCPGCSKQYPLTPELAGRKVQCVGCGTTFSIPAAAGATAAKAQAAPSKVGEAGVRRAVKCPGCGSQYPITPELAGKKVQCTSCKTAFAIPGPLGTGASAPAREMASPRPPAPAREMTSSPPPAPPASDGVGDFFSEELDAATAAAGPRDPAAVLQSGGLDNLFADEFGGGASAPASGGAQGSFSATLPPASSAAGSTGDPMAGGGTLSPLPRKKKSRGEGDGGLMRFGIGLVVFGSLAMILPLFGLQFKILNFPGAETAIPIIAILIGAAGSALIWYGLRHDPGLGAASGGGALVCVLIVFLVTQSMGPGGGPMSWFGGSKHERLIKEWIGNCDELSDVLSKIRDGESARAAAGEVDTLAEQFVRLMTEAAELQKDISPEEDQRLGNKYGDKFKAALTRLGGEMGRVAQLPEARDALAGSMEKMATAALTTSLAVKGARPPKFPSAPSVPSGARPPRIGRPTPPSGPTNWVNSHDHYRQKMNQKHGAAKVVTVKLTNLPEGGGDYADMMLGKAAPKSSRMSSASGGDRVVTLAPVEGGAAALAAKIDFGTVSDLDAAAGTFVVRADRSKFPPPPGAPVTNPQDPNFYKQNLADLKGLYDDRRREALDRLKAAEPKELKKEIAAAMVEIARGNDHFMRIGALEALCYWGNAELIESLAPLVSDEDVFVAQAAAKALAATKDPRAAEPIAAQMGTPLRADEYLKEMGPAAEGAVLDHIDAADVSNCREACQILLVIGTDKSVPRLKELTRHADRSVQREADSALRRIESGMVAPTPGGEEVPAVTNPNDPNFYKQNLADLNHYEEGRRRDAIQRLIAAEPKELRKEIADALLKVAKGGDHWTRNDAVKALAAWAGPETVPGLTELLGEEDRFVVEGAMKALAGTGDPRAAEALAAMVGQRMGVDRHLISMGPAAEDAVLALLDSPDEKLVADACKVLGEIGTRKSAAKLKRLARSNNFFIRVNAERAAAQASQRRSTAAPGGAAESTDNPTGRPTAGRSSIDGLLLQLQLSATTAGSAANKLAAMPVDEQRRAEVSAALIKLLGTPDDQAAGRAGNLVSDATRRSAVGALAVWIAPEDVPRMARFLDHGSQTIRWATFDALAKVKTEVAARAVAPKILGDDGRAATKALGAMGELGESAVLEYLNSDDPAWRGAACSALAQIGTKKSLPRLKELAANKEEAVRFSAALAVEAIEKRQK